MVDFMYILPQWKKSYQKLKLEKNFKTRYLSSKLLLSI